MHVGILRKPENHKSEDFRRAVRIICGTINVKIKRVERHLGECEDFENVAKYNGEFKALARVRTVLFYFNF